MMIFLARVCVCLAQKQFGVRAAACVWCGGAFPTSLFGVVCRAPTEPARGRYQLYTLVCRFSLHPINSCLFQGLVFVYCLFHGLVFVYCLFQGLLILLFVNVLVFNLRVVMS
jgi:hypothetical protein